jgi:AbrB family looped-hinge helix DNA binding protein
LKIVKWSDTILVNMHFAKISSQHQITIPIEIMRQLGLSQADKLLVILKNGKIVLEPQTESVVDQMAGSLDELISEDKKGKTWKEIKSESKRIKLEQLTQGNK